MQVTVILTHMFSPDEVASDPRVAQELEADITSEATRLGPITKVGNASALASHVRPGSCVWASVLHTQVTAGSTR